MTQQVLNMRDEVSCASQVGDIQTVTSISSKLGKLQRALEKRISDDQDHYDERAIESDRANYDTTNGTATRSTRKMEFSSYAESSTSDDFLSKEELIALRSQLENEMISVDTKTREGMAEWRLRYKNIKGPGRGFVSLAMFALYILAWQIFQHIYSVYFSAPDY